MNLHNLKPCPFCGGEAGLSSVGTSYMAHCYTPNCIMEVTPYFASVENAVDAWNKRADEGNHATDENRKSGESAFDDVNHKWLSLLLTFLSTDPPRREIAVRAESGGKTVNITYDPHDPEAVKAAEVWRNALFADGTQSKDTKPDEQLSDRLCKTPASVERNANPDALMNTVTNNSFYLRKVETPTPCKHYLRRGMTEGETGYLSPVLYIGDGLFYDYIGNFRAFDKSEFWTFASASEYRVTGTPHEPGMTPREYVKDAVEKCLQNKQKYVDELAAAMEPWTPDKPAETVKSDEPAEPIKARESLLGYEPLIGSNIDFADKIGYLWEESSSGRGYDLRWRDYPGGDANRVCNLYYDGVEGYYHVKAFHEGNAGISLKDCTIRALLIKQAMAEVEQRAKKHLQEAAAYSKTRLDKWKPANQATPKDCEGI